MRTPATPIVTHVLRRGGPRPKGHESIFNTVIKPEDRAVGAELARRAAEEAEMARSMRGQGIVAPPTPAPVEEEAPPAPRRMAVTSAPREIPPALAPVNLARYKEFVKLVEGRVTKTLNDMDQIKFLSSKERYDYTAEDVDEILTALNNKLAEIETAFAEQGKRRPRVVFQLSRKAIPAEN